MSWRSGRFRRRVFCGAGVASVGALGVAATAQVPHFPVNVDVVRVSVLVKGRDGPLPDLAAADFELRDNGVPQRIEAISSEHLPLSLVHSTGRRGEAALVLERAIAGKEPDSIDPFRTYHSGDRTEERPLLQKVKEMAQTLANARDLP
jgi:hypothetical protein